MRFSAVGVLRDFERRECFWVFVFILRPVYAAVSGSVSKWYMDQRGRVKAYPATLDILIGFLGTF